MIIRRDRPVLIAENYPDTLELLCMQFRRQGFEVIGVSDAPSAIKAYRSFPSSQRPCLAILDAALGAAGTGFDVARAIKQIDVYDLTLKIIYTAHDAAADPMGLHTEVDAILRKELCGNELFGEILRVADQKQQGAAIAHKEKALVAPIDHSQWGIFHFTGRELALYAVNLIFVLAATWCLASMQANVSALTSAEKLSELKIADVREKLAAKGLLNTIPAEDKDVSKAPSSVR